MGHSTFWQQGKLNPRYVGPLKVIEKVRDVAYKLELLEELSRVHNTFHVSNLKKCYTDEPLAVSLDGALIFDDSFSFVQGNRCDHGPCVKLIRLKQSSISLVKVRWNSKRGPKFTWEREDQFQKKYPHLFTKTLHRLQVAFDHLRDALSVIFGLSVTQGDQSRVKSSELTLLAGSELKTKIEHLKKIYKDQFDSIKKTHAFCKEHGDSLIAQLNSKSMENADLKHQLQDKVFVITSLKNDLRKLKGKETVENAAQIPIATTVALGMFKLDLDYLAPRLLQNREAHIYYLKHTQETKPNHLWGSNATDVPSSFLLSMTGCPDCSLLQAMIDQGIVAALATRDANRSTNGEDSHNSGTGVRRTERVAQECTYQDFMKCQTLFFKGTEGVVKLTQSFERMETVFRISNCIVENQIKFSTCTLLGVALTWWNSHVRTVGHDIAYAMTWTDLKKKMTDKYCPRSEIKKLEIELWNLKESDKIEKYVDGLPDMIHGSVMASRPKTMQDAIEMAMISTDKIKIIRKRSKSDKHGHEERKSTKEARNSKPKSSSGPSYEQDPSLETHYRQIPSKTYALEDEDLTDDGEDLPLLSPLWGAWAFVISPWNMLRWTLDSSDEFSVSFARYFLDGRSLFSGGSSTRWNNFVAIKLNILLWRIGLTRIPTRDNLESRRIVLDSNLCPMCFTSLETIKHVFADHVELWGIWSNISRW
ncbi:reverse transcriptase domain-containing protein [Tanacetum coccineum]